MGNSKVLVLFTIFLLVSFAGALDSSKYEEKGCAAAAPDKSLSEAFISKQAAWYVPMASAYSYNLWVEKLTNQSATPDKFPKLCLKLLFLASSDPNKPYLVAVGGLDKVVTHQCSSNSLQVQSCEGVPGSPNYAPGVESVETIVKTDNKEYLLMVTCVRNQVKSWYVMTPTENEPNKADKDEIVKTILALGFDKKYASGIPYAGCPKPKN